MKRLKKLALLLVVASIIACKKEKKEDPYPTFEQLYVVKYEIKVQGNNAKGIFLYINPETKKTETDTIKTGTSAVKIFLIKKGTFLSLTTNAETDINHSAIAESNIYIDNNMVASKQVSGTWYATATIDYNFN